MDAATRRAFRLITQHQNMLDAMDREHAEFKATIRRDKRRRKLPVAPKSTTYINSK